MRKPRKALVEPNSEEMFFGRVPAWQWTWVEASWIVATVVLARRAFPVSHGRAWGVGDAGMGGGAEVSPPNSFIQRKKMLAARGSRSIH